MIRSTPTWCRSRCARRPAPDARVAAWIDAQPLETLFLSATTVAAAVTLTAWLALLTAWGA